MKFIELKKDLQKNIRPAYLITGNDRFLCFSALEQIKNALAINYKDLNEVIMQGDSVSKEDIARSASVFPFLDKYRLVQVNDYKGKGKAKSGEDELLKYLNNPILFCNNDMARISSELDKLISFAGDREIVEEDVLSLVVEDKEYQVFELAEFIARGEKVKALDLLYTLSNAGRSGFSILTPLYNNYRRALFVAINKDKTEEEIASLLSVKPYAIKMMRNQVKVFTPKKLKLIVDMLYEADRNIKMGKIKEDVAIKTATLNILKIRG